MAVSHQTQQLIEKYQSWYKSLQPKEGVTTIHVDEVASKVAAFYEKIKGVVDWREEHLLRKRAIERTLKRKIVFNQEQKQGMAEPLVYELIRGGHFPNNTIPEARIEKVQKILDKYFFILEVSLNAAEKEDALLAKKNQFQHWLLEIASYEIEKTLSPALREEALIRCMAESLKEQIIVREGVITIKGITEQEKNTQIYIAVQKALFKLDDSTIAYGLLNRRFPEWSALSPSSPLLSEIARNCYIIQKSVEKDLHHPLAEKFFNICEKYNTPYLILGDIIAEDPSKAQEILEKPEELESKIKKTYSQRLTKLKSRIRRAAIYSTLSIFITKIVLALAIEVPIDKYIIGEFSNLTLGINVLFPPFLMFLLVATIRAPIKENLQRVVMEVMKLCYHTEKKDVYELIAPKKRGRVLNGVIFIIYGLAFLISFGMIIVVLQKLNFGILSTIIFIFFVSVISFLGAKIRERSKELTIETGKETGVQTLFDFFTLPIVFMGRWLSEKWTGFNIALIIAALIDMPLLTFVQFLEQWRYFLKEKKEKIH